MRRRKIHAGEAGYVAERMNPHVPGRKVTIYLAAEQGIDVGEDRFAVVCDEHATIVGAPSERTARRDMKAPEEFCEPCRALAEGKPDPTLPSTIEVVDETVEPAVTEVVDLEGDA